MSKANILGQAVPSSTDNQTNISNANEEAIYEIFEAHHTEINTTLVQLHKELPYLKDAINLVIGESKSGKTFTTIQSLVNNGLKDSVIHLDFDRNSDSKLRELGVKTYHINDVDKLLKSISKPPRDELVGSLVGKILVIDSLQDLSLSDGLDSNSGALLTMGRVQGFKDTGATIIVIHHVTLDIDGNPKVKGNASVITSKSDTTISFIKEKPTQRLMKVLNTRAEDKIASGTMFYFPKKVGNNVPK